MSEDRAKVELIIRYRDFDDTGRSYGLYVETHLIPSVIPRIMAIGFSINRSFTRNDQPKISCVHIPPHRILDIRWEVDNIEGERI